MQTGARKYCKTLIRQSAFPYKSIAMYIVHQKLGRVRVRAFNKMNNIFNCRCYSVTLKACGKWNIILLVFCSSFKCADLLSYLHNVLFIVSLLRRHYWSMYFCMNLQFSRTLNVLLFFQNVSTQTCRKIKTSTHS